MPFLFTSHLINKLLKGSTHIMEKMKKCFVKGSTHIMEKMKKCFVISPIGEEKSEIRIRADQILNYIIDPVAQECGFRAIRADKISKPGIITNQVIEHIIEDPLIIADLTGKNPNVFYELAIRHSIRKPLVQIIQKGEDIPFDVSVMRTIPIDHRDLDDVEEAKKEMKKQIEDVINKNPNEIESPISMSLAIQSLKHSDKPEGRSLADIRKYPYPKEKLIPIEYVEEMMKRSERRRSDQYGGMMRDSIYTLEKLEHELSGKNLHSVYFVEIDKLKQMLATLQRNIFS